jgi:hypothetical protein
VLDRNKDAEIYTLLRQSNAYRENRHIPHCWVIGEPEYVRDAITKDEQHRLRIARYQHAGWDLHRLAAFIAEQYALDPQYLLRRSRGTEVSDARKVFAYLGYRLLDIPVAGIARFMRLSGPSVSVMAQAGGLLTEQRGRASMAQNKLIEMVEGCSHKTG